jgi:hypothetical protein
VVPLASGGETVGAPACKSRRALCLSFSRRSLADRQHAQSFETFFAELRLASQSEIVYLAKTGHRGDDLAAKGLRFFETPEPERCTEIVGLETERLPMDQSALSRSPTLLPHRSGGPTTASGRDRATRASVRETNRLLVPDDGISDTRISRCVTWFTVRQRRRRQMRARWRKE